MRATEGAFKGGVPSALPVPSHFPARNASTRRPPCPPNPDVECGRNRAQCSRPRGRRERNCDQWQTTGATVHDLETANLLSLARVLVAAALARYESRGAHFREDFPETSADFQRSLVYSQTIAKATAVGC